MQFFPPQSTSPPLPHIYASKTPSDTVVPTAQNISDPDLNNQGVMEVGISLWWLRRWVEEDL